MVSTYTPNKRLEQPGFNDYVDTWDVPVNNDWSIIDLALGGSVSINTTGLSGNQTLVTAQYQPLKIVLTGAPTAAINYRVPSGVGGIWVVRNNTTGGQTVTIDSIAGGSAVTIPAGTNTLVTCDGTASGMFLAINTAPAAAGSNTQVQYNSAGVLAGSAALTFDGTTLTAGALSVAGNTTLGDAAGDSVTLNGATAAIPNTLNFGSNTLFLQPTGTKVGIGTATLGSEMLTVAGVIYTTAGGIKFPDGTTQSSAASAVAGSNTQVQFNDGGTFGGINTFTFNKVSGLLSVPALSLSGALAVGTNATVGGNLTVTGTISATGGILGGVTGTVTAFAGSVLPTGALFCDGASYATATYPGLFAAIGYTYGGSGANFNVPDLRGRVIAGRDNMGGSAAGRLTSTTMTPDGETLGATGGTQARTFAYSGSTDSFGPSYNVDGSVAISPVTGAHAHSYSGNTTSASILQPTLVMNYIIFT